MVVRLEVFAKMIDVKEGQIIYALRNDGVIKGLELPTPKYNRGNRASPNFDLNDVLDFESRLKDK